MSNQNQKEEHQQVSFGTPTLNEWKMYFRNLQQAPVEQSGATTESSEESSFELDESFRLLLDRKRQQLQDQVREEQMPSESEAGCARDGMEAPGCSNVMSGNDSTFLEQDSISKVTDTSFEEMERICAVLDKVDRHGMNAGGAGERMREKPAPAISATFGDITQLDDVDEPSGFWENTILPGSGPLNSPVKRMHLFRPSTIIEESTINEAGGSKNSSIDTFASAQQRESREVESRNSDISGSEIYRTAEDTFATDSYARSSAMDSGSIYDNTAVDNQTAIEHHERHDEESTYSQNSTVEVGPNNERNVIVLDSSDSEPEYDVEGHMEQPAPVIPLPTVRITDESASFLDHDDQCSLPGYLDDSVDDGPNLSELEEMPDRFNDTLEETDFMLKQGMKLMAMAKKDDEQQQHIEEHQLLQSVGNELQPAKSRTNSDSDDGATYIHHMMHTPVDKDASKRTDTSSYSYLTPSSAMRSKLNVSHGVGSGCKQTLFSSAGKPNSAKKIPGPPSAGSAIPGAGGQFKRPVVSRLPQLKVGRKFDHIVSPIGAYIKKTPQSMLQSKINCPNKNLIDVLHSENRDSIMSSRGSKENYHGGAVNVKGYIPSLPGKGVISSNRAHVLDERNPVRIPGGEKMQKLINNSPTMVIRHEGRIRYAGEAGGSGRRLMMNDSTFGDDSLKDISVASNDVSVRVLHDAERFFEHQ